METLDNVSPVYYYDLEAMTVTALKEAKQELAKMYQQPIPNLLDITNQINYIKELESLLGA
jgi:hypothetical protein